MLTRRGFLKGITAVIGLLGIGAKVVEGEPELPDVKVEVIELDGTRREIQDSVEWVEVPLDEKGPARYFSPLPVSEELMADACYYEEFITMLERQSFLRLESWAIPADTVRDRCKELMHSTLLSREQSFLTTVMEQCERGL